LAGATAADSGKTVMNLSPIHCSRTGSAWTFWLTVFPESAAVAPAKWPMNA
jgi:hypothetical protein